MRRVLVATGALCLAVSCGGEDAPAALDEPLRVQGAAFKRGPLPGRDGPRSSVAITALETASSVVEPYQTGKSLLGRTTTDGLTVGLALEGLGSGYWVLPVEGPDPTAGGELAWLARLDFGLLPAGLRRLQVVAFDNAGAPGAVRDVQLCVAGRVPDNLSACDSSRPPPSALITLEWAQGSDVDLVVRVPGGKLVDAKHPAVAEPADGGAPASLDRDSNAGCIQDGRRQENLVFTGAPPPGVYQIYARLFDACGAGTTHFTATVREARPSPAGGATLEVVRSRTGVLTPIDARGGRDLGLFVTEVTFPSGGGS